MIIFGTKTTTIFNREWDDENEREIWHSTALVNTNLVLTQGLNISKSGVEEADTAKLFVDPAEQAKEYKKPKEYAGLPDKSNVYTFDAEHDFFVAGDVTSEESQETGFFEYMKAKYDDIYRVTTVDEYKDVMPHIEVGGK